MERCYRPLCWGRVVILLVALTLLQTTLLGQVNFHGARPGLLLPLVVIFGAGTHWRSAGLLGWLVGVSKDLFSGTPFGTFALLYTVAGLSCAHTAQRAFADHLLTMGLLSLAVGLAVNAGCVLMTAWYFQDLLGYVHKGLVSALFVPIVVVIVYPVVRRAHRWFGLRFGVRR